MKVGAVMSVSYYDLYCETIELNEELEKENSQLKKLYKSSEQRYQRLEAKVDEKIANHENKVIEELQKENDDLKNQISHLKALLNRDSTNSSTPTSQTPLNKKKHIPNSRKKSNKKKGGQFSHPKHRLCKFDDDEITEVVQHNNASCPNCHHEMIPTGRVVFKDEFELDIVVRKIRHEFIEMKCCQCGYKEIVNIPVNLKEENQYGANIQAFALTLMNEGYVSINRTKEIIANISNDEIQMSEGYLAKIQKRLAKNLSGFYEALRRKIISLKIVHWDDTVIMVSTNRACLRFYGDEMYAFYASHMHKDKAGLDEDAILMSLDKDTIVVHDHNKVNYNDDYEFENAECCAHLLRDLKKDVDNLNHEWPKQMIELLVKANVERNEAGTVDSDEISKQYDILIERAKKENEAEPENRYYVDTENTLIKRLVEYKRNYLLWTLNEDVPFSNNVSERSLRSSKTKMKISGQFENLNNAVNFAIIKSYIETGKRFGMNINDLIVRALKGNPATVEEMEKHNDD